MELSLDASKIFIKHLIDLLKTNKKILKTGKGIFKQFVVGGTGMILGGVVGGPVGFVIGGAIGLFVGYVVSDDYQSLIDVLKNLTDEEKKELAMKVREHVGDATKEALNKVIDTKVRVVDFLKFLDRTVKEIKKS